MNQDDRRSKLTAQLNGAVAAVIDEAMKDLSPEATAMVAAALEQGAEFRLAIGTGDPWLIAIALSWRDGSRQSIPPFSISGDGSSEGDLQA